MITTTRSRLGSVCVFMEEQPPHSKYNVRTVANSLTPISGMELFAISNGCSVSEELKTFLAVTGRVFHLGLSSNIGLPGAWNIGLDLLDCDYLFLLNDDLWLDKRCIEGILDIFEDFPDTAVAGVEGVVSSELDAGGFPVTETKHKKTKGLLKRSTVIDVSAVSGFLFALSMKFVKDTGFRFDTRFTPAFCEEFDLAYYARNKGYKTRIITGLDRHYDHAFGVSSGPKDIHYLDSSIRSDMLSERNKRLFREKWGAYGAGLLGP